MKYLTSLLAAAAVLTCPVFSFAQNTAPLTRAQVRADLARVEQAGYYPSTEDHNDYPAGIQATEAKIAREDNRVLANNAVGGATMTGTSSAGGHFPQSKSAQSLCVGPATFCNLYSGS